MNQSNNNGAAMPIEFEKTRLNVWNIGSIFAGIALTAFGWGMTYAKIEQNDGVAQQAITDLKSQIAAETQARKDRGLLTDGRFKAIEDKIPQFEVIALQIQRLTEVSAQNAKAIEATNDRLSRIVESQSGKLDTIISRQAELASDVKVIQSQLDEQRRTRQTRLEIPDVRIK